MDSEITGAVATEITYSPSLMMMDEQISLSGRFCRCWDMERCDCGEKKDEGKDWRWDESTKSSACILAEGEEEVTFHPTFSVGTACIRGDRPFEHGYQHYFELKVLTPCFGTDIMIGLGTDKVDMQKFERRFASLLGCCSESWGLSYKGHVFHNDQWHEFGGGFGQGSIVGVHVDLWHGNMSYYVNRKLIGTAFTNLRDPSVNYYPMVCSTAAKSRIRLIAARSYSSNLQYFCANTIQQSVAYGEKVLPGVCLPPMLKRYLENNMNWLLIGSGARRTSDQLEFPDPEEIEIECESDAVAGHSSTVSRRPNRMDHFARKLALIPFPSLQELETRMIRQPFLTHDFADRISRESPGAVASGSRQRGSDQNGNDRDQSVGPDEEGQEDPDEFVGPSPKRHRH